MALTNAYASLAQLRDVNQTVDINDTSLNNRFVLALNAASRLIDDHCGQTFWADSAASARTFYPEQWDELCVPPISTETGLIVEVDSADNGFTAGASTLTITTDYITAPINSLVMTPKLPITAFKIVNNGTGFTGSSYGRPTVKVTAKWGWPAVPDQVAQACLIQAEQIYKAPETQFVELNPVAWALVERFVIQE